MKALLRFALLLVPALFVACTETLPPEDSNLPASGAPQAWENTMPGMGGMMPQDR
ncbi:MAG: hypothetical protein IKW49_08025 [Opitutales bacterium]|nr:hypothetical protein [Opitutales bacterium]